MELRKPAIVFFISALILGIFSIFLIKNTEPVYGVNDDKIIESWVSGEYTGEPEFMVSVSATPKIIFGIALSSLYKLNDQIPWYGMYLVAIVIIGWALLFVLIFMKSNWVYLIILIILAGTYLNWFIPAITYTSAAVIPSIGSLIWIFYLINRKILKFSYFLFLGVIFGLGYVTRPESAFLALLVVSTIAIFSIVPKLKNGNSKLVILCLLPLASIISVNYVMEQEYLERNPDWVKFKEFENARYQIQANQIERDLRYNPAKYGWTEEETSIFVTYEYADKNVFTTEKFNQVIKLHSNFEDFSINKIVISGVRNLFSSDINQRWINFLLFSTIIFVVFFIKSLNKSINYSVIYLAGIVITISALIYISAYLRLPERVLVSFYFLIILIPIIFDPFFKPRYANNKKTSLVISYLLLGVSCFFIFKQIDFQKNRNNAYSANRFLDSQIMFFQSFPEDTIFVGNASQFRDQWQSPMTFNKKLLNSQILSLGWHTFSPHWEKRVKNLGLDSNRLFQQVAKKNNLLWVADSNSIRQLENYFFQKNYSKNQFRLIDSIDYFGEEYSVWSLVNKDVLF